MSPSTSSRTRSARPSTPLPHARDASAITDALPYTTKNDLPADARHEVVALLTQRLADCLDLQSQCKQAHWNVKGHHFMSLHVLFDQVHGAVLEYSDLIAERIAQLGGVAEGTARTVAQRTSLLDYPLTLSAGHQHVAALSDVLAQFGRVARIGIEEMNELEDAVSADMLTEIARGLDKWLWFVEAHEQHDGGHPAG